ncbi:MAG: FixH family protein [Candidatus Kapaibacteriota bacterium]|jgi:hypothetical protein
MFKKFNWGWGIAIVYGSFVLTFLVFLAYTTTQKVELVSEDYYNSELTYQSRLEAINRVKQIDSIISFKIDKKLISFNLPFISNNIQNGIVKLYRPSNSKLDKSFVINDLISLKSGLNSSLINLDLNNLTQGMWKVQVEWSIADSSYYFEKTIFL